MSEKRDSVTDSSKDNTEKANKTSGFQEQLDVFMEQEESLLLDSETAEGDATQDHLDHFVEDIDQQLEADSGADFGT